MSEQVLLEERQGGILYLRMNRPDRLNAVNGALMDALLDATQRAADDPDVRCVVLTGEGRGFCAGGDVREGAKAKEGMIEKKHDDPLQQAAYEHFTRTYTSHLLHTMPKPTIALVRGAAMGAGMSLALACDYRIISDAAVFRSAFVNNALSGDYGIGYFLAKLVGNAKAMELMMLSPKIDAAKAEKLGLATRVVPDAELEAAGAEMAEKLANGPTVAYAGVKRNVVAAGHLSLHDYLMEEAINQSRCAFSEDIREAGRAFIQKRPPVFKGR